MYKKTGLKTTYWH